MALLGNEVSISISSTLPAAAACHPGLYFFTLSFTWVQGLGSRRSTNSDSVSLLLESRPNDSTVKLE